MTPLLILGILLIYTLVLFFVTWFTARKADSQSFFLGNKISPWFVVAYGMIGASLSGVTFMSVPGWVKDTQFSYMVVVLGYLVGYFVIALVLLPLYYRLKLTSIYSYLEQRFGYWSYKTGAGFFILSRTLGASLRMFLVIKVLQIFVFDAWNVPFWINVLVFIILIILYTFKGGIRTIIWTDTLQTTFMLLAVILSVIYIGSNLHIPLGKLVSVVKDSSVSKMFITDWHHPRFFLKQFFSGMFITIVMTGLDQEMMQKNLSCKNVREAQKNMFTFSGILVFVNLLFLFLGALLLIFMQNKGISVVSSDDIFPTVAIRYLGPLAGVVFLIGLISAAFPSADGALTSLTTVVSIDFLGLERREGISEKARTRIRYAIFSPVVCFFLSKYSVELFFGYKFGFELLLLNGLLTYAGLYIFSKKDVKAV